MTTNDKTSAFDSERRERIRYAARLSVNFRHGDTYLYCRSSNVSELGIFLVSKAPLPTGTVLELEFKSQASRHPIRVAGEVRWVESGMNGAEAGMGIQFVNLSDEVRTQLKTLIRTIAYLE
jgi:uncharacterized protein (TIGR02266 family)